MKHRSHERDSLIFRPYGGTRDWKTGDPDPLAPQADTFDKLPRVLCSRCGYTVLRARNETGICSLCAQHMRREGEEERTRKNAERVEVGKRGWETRRKNAAARTTK